MWDYDDDGGSDVSAFYVSGGTSGVPVLKQVDLDGDGVPDVVFLFVDGEPRYVLADRDRDGELETLERCGGDIPCGGAE